MSELDHIAISRILGSTFQPFSPRPFGGFAPIPAVGEMLATLPKPVVRLERDDARDRKIVDAFTGVHGGYSVDRLLADPALAQAFVERCRALGINDPAAAIYRRLLRIRKASDLPVRLPKTTKVDNRDLFPFLIAAELAFAQLGYRYNVSYDDLLAEPELGSAFDMLAKKLGNTGSIVDYRLAALHLRKNLRSRSKDEQNLLEDIGVIDVSTRWEAVGPMAKVSAKDLPDGEGIFGLTEPNRYLYLTRFPNVQEGVARFKNPGTLDALGNRFWMPTPEAISVQIIQPKRGDTPLRLLELKALELYRPVFNLLPKAA